MKMYLGKSIAVILVSSVMTIASAAVTADATNTGLNKRDQKSPQTVTADQQSRGSDHDVELTRLARQRIISEDALSTNAKNVKIITLNSVMTLRGPVDSQAEKNRVGELAKAAAPRIAVVNELDVNTATK